MLDIILLTIVVLCWAYMGYFFGHRRGYEKGFEDGLRAINTALSKLPPYKEKVAYRLDKAWRENDQEKG